MSVFIEYRVIEEYDDAAPEPFGFERIAIESAPKPGDVIMLHWLDGRDAYRVRVDRISTSTLYVSPLERLGQ